MIQFFSRSAGLVLLFSTALLAFTLALFLIIAQFAGPERVMDAALCQLGLSDECLLDDLRAEKAKLKALQSRTAELKALYERLNAVDYAASSFLVFYRSEKGGLEVMTGHRFESLIKPDAFEAAWCRIWLPRKNSIARSITIATAESDLKVRELEISTDDLQASGLTPEDVRDALRFCQWPDGATLG